MPSKRKITSTVNSTVTYESLQTVDLAAYELNDNNLAEKILTKIVEEIKSRSNSNSSNSSIRELKNRSSVDSEIELNQKASKKFIDFEIKPSKMFILSKHAATVNEYSIDKLKKTKTSSNRSIDKLSEQGPLVSITSFKFPKNKPNQLENSVIVNNMANNAKLIETDKQADSLGEKTFQQGVIDAEVKPLDFSNNQKKSLTSLNNNDKAKIKSESDAFKQGKQSILSDKISTKSSKISNDKKVNTNIYTVTSVVNQETKNKSNLKTDEIANISKKADTKPANRNIPEIENKKIIKKFSDTMLENNLETKNETKLRRQFDKDDEAGKTKAVAKQSNKKTQEPEQILEKLPRNKPKTMESSNKTINYDKKETNKINDNKKPYPKENIIQITPAEMKETNLINQNINDEQKSTNRNTPTESTIDFNKRSDKRSSVKQTKLSKDHLKSEIRQKTRNEIKTSTKKEKKENMLLIRDDFSKISKPAELKPIKEEKSMDLSRESVKKLSFKKLTTPKRVKRLQRKKIRKQEISKENKLESETNKNNSIKNKQTNTAIINESKYQKNIQIALPKDILPSYEIFFSSKKNQKEKPLSLETNNSFIETVSGTFPLSIHDSDSSYLDDNENELQLEEKELFETAQKENIHLEENQHEDANKAEPEQSLLMDENTGFINESRGILNEQIAENPLMEDDINDSLNKNGKKEEAVDIEEAIVVQNNETNDHELYDPDKQESVLKKTSTPFESDKNKSEKDETLSDSHSDTAKFQFIRIEMKDKSQESIKIVDENFAKTDNVSQPVEEDDSEVTTESAEPLDEQLSFSFERNETLNDLSNEENFEELQIENIEGKLDEPTEPIDEQLPFSVKSDETQNNFPGDEPLKELQTENELLNEKNKTRPNSASSQDYTEEIRYQLDTEIISEKPTDEIEYSSCNNTPLIPEHMVSENESDNFKTNEINPDYNFPMFSKYLSHDDKNLNKKRKSEVPLLFSINGYSDYSSSDEEPPNSASKMKKASCAVQALQINRKNNQLFFYRKLFLFFSKSIKTTIYAHTLKFIYS